MPTKVSVTYTCTACGTRSASSAILSRCEVCEERRCAGRCAPLVLVVAKLVKMHSAQCDCEGCAALAAYAAQGAGRGGDGE